MKKSVAAAVFYLDGKILITRRVPGEKLTGMWEFPGDKIEHEETPQEYIIREIREELGEILAISNYTYPGDGSY